MTVHEVKERADELQIVDVRSPEEWEEGHIPGAIHIFLPELKKRAGELVKKKPVAVYCDSGYRASIGTSILQQEGFQVTTSLAAGKPGRTRNTPLKNNFIAGVTNMHSLRLLSVVTVLLSPRGCIGGSGRNRPSRLFRTRVVALFGGSVDRCAFDADVLLFQQAAGGLDRLCTGCRHDWKNDRTSAHRVAEVLPRQ